VRQEYFGKLTRKIHSWFNQFNSDIKKESYFDVTLFFSWWSAWVLNRAVHKS